MRGYYGEAIIVILLRRLWRGNRWEKSRESLIDVKFKGSVRLLTDSD